MIALKPLFGILSSLFILVGGIPYLKDIYQGKAHPHVLSWIGWAFITALGASAMLAGGSTWAVAILFANTLLCLTIAGYSIIKKVGVWSTGIYDYVFFALGIVGLVLWQVLDMPIIALVCAIVADLSFGLPTIIKTYKDPSTETSFVWITATLSGLLSLFAVQNFAFHEVAYPMYLFIYDSTVLILVLGLFVKPQKSSQKMTLSQYQVIIENKKNSYKSFVGEGEESAYPLKGVTYPVDYGYIEGYRAEDGDELDIFVGSGNIFGYITVWRLDVPIETKMFAQITQEEFQAIQMAFAPVLVKAQILDREAFDNKVEEYRIGK